MSRPKAWNGNQWVDPAFDIGAGQFLSYIPPAYDQVVPGAYYNFDASNQGWETWRSEPGWVAAPHWPNSHILTPSTTEPLVYPAEVDLRSPQTGQAFKFEPGKPYHFSCSYRLDALSQTFPTYGIRLEFSAWLFSSYWGGAGAGSTQIVEYGHDGTGGAWWQYDGPAFYVTEDYRNSEGYPTMGVGIDADYFGNADYYRLWLDWAGIFDQYGQPVKGLGAPGWEPRVKRADGSWK